jgi:hypothetical protein
MPFSKGDADPVKVSAQAGTLSFHAGERPVLLWLARD